MFSSRKGVIILTYSRGPQEVTGLGPLGHCTSGRPLNPPLAYIKGFLLFPTICYTANYSVKVDCPREQHQFLLKHRSKCPPSLSAIPCMSQLREVAKVPTLVKSCSYNEFVVCCKQAVVAQRCSGVTGRESKR